ncbi:MULTISPECIES: protoglobin domain-containing protein [Bacillus]|uniref:Heme-based aerotactic transducer n=1 Tax=Bacillus capparidis TaxID=1840411 RepID=A0ABS4CPP3_9BACI|nr:MULTISPECIES: protoglobin domain-containing protein [Bacillus]MBP1079548.1 heme-based aerotactic transducer [Bacillus capparidis]MED1094949.1 protoglobin domain-containing protein [Bacillus capparidis]
MLFGKKNEPLIFKWLQAGTGQRINSELSGEMKRQLQMISLEEEDLEILSRLKPIVSREIETIVNKFYQNLAIESSLEETINRHSSVERLKKTLMIHIQEMFTGRIEEEFLEKRKRIAHIHLRIGLIPKWYICAFLEFAFIIYHPF